MELIINQIKTKSFYIYLILKYFIPIYTLAFLVYWKRIYRVKKFLIFSAIFGFVAFYIIDPIAISWNAWGFDYTMTLNIRIFNKSVIEELIWAVLLCVFVGIVISILIEKVDTKRPFFIPSFIYKRIKSNRARKIISTLF